MSLIYGHLLSTPYWYCIWKGSNVRVDEVCNEFLFVGLRTDMDMENAIESPQLYTM